MSSQWSDPGELLETLELDNQKVPRQKQPSDLSSAPAVPFWSSVKTPGHEDSSDRGRNSHQREREQLAALTASKNAERRERASAKNPWFKSFNSSRIPSFALGSVLRRQQTNGEHLNQMAEVQTGSFYHFGLRTEQSRWRAKVAIVGIMLIVIAIAMGVYYTSDEGSNNTPGFCGDDEDLREDIASFANIVGDVVEIDSGTVICLPEKAFSSLEELDLTGVTDLDFTLSVLESVSPNAFLFSEAFAAQITSFALKETQLTEIPSDVLQSFSNLLDVDFSSGIFAQIGEEIFENFTDFDSVNLASNEVLFSFPTALRSLGSIGTLDFKDCTNLTTVENDFFSITSVGVLDLSNTPLVGLEASLESFLERIGLPNTTTVIGFD